MGEARVALLVILRQVDELGHVPLAYLLEGAGTPLRPTVIDEEPRGDSKEQGTARLPPL